MAAQIGPIDPGAFAPLVTGPAANPKEAAEKPAPRAEPAPDKNVEAKRPEPSPVETVNARLTIERDDEADAFVYKIVDPASGEIVRQFPQEEVLEVLRYFGQQAGIVADRRV